MQNIVNLVNISVVEVVLFIYFLTLQTSLGRFWRSSGIGGQFRCRSKAGCNWPQCFIWPLPQHVPRSGQQDHSYRGETSYAKRVWKAFFKPLTIINAFCSLTVNTHQWFYLFPSSYHQEAILISMAVLRPKITAAVSSSSASLESWRDNNTRVFWCPDLEHLALPSVRTFHPVVAMNAVSNRSANVV